MWKLSIGYKDVYFADDQLERAMKLFQGLSGVESYDSMYCATTNSYVLYRAPLTVTLQMVPDVDPAAVEPSYDAAEALVARAVAAAQEKRSKP